MTLETPLESVVTSQYDTENDNELNSFIDELRDELNQVNLNNLLELPNSIKNNYSGMYNNIYLLSDTKDLPKEIDIYRGAPACINTIKLTCRSIDNINNNNCSITISDDLSIIPQSTRIINGEVNFFFAIDRISDVINLKISKNLEIKKVGVYGFHIKNVIALCDTLKGIDKNIESNAKFINSKYNNLIKNKKSEINNINEDIKNKNIELSVNKNRIELQESQLKEINEYIIQSQKTLDNNNKITNDLIARQNDINEEINSINLGKEVAISSVKEIYSNIEKGKSDKKELEKNINEIKSNLEKYKKEASIYSTELKDFKKEIKTQNRTYLFYLSVFITTISIITYGIYSSSMQYIAIFSSPLKVDLVQLLLSRSPLILLNIGLIALYSKLLMILIPNIIDNNKQLSKVRQIEFLVKESVASLNLPTDEAIRLKLEYKMQIIREALQLTKENIINTPIESNNKKEDKEEEKITLSNLLKELKSLKEIVSK
ncbi:hypothetical protein PLEI_4203 [Photobacterium leiognathi lrivu.4.1]|uniref:Uncharacterized protein n=1 Tax=Photobacterium leiognathi lrivu.4.1 TaxID=1248232 RepID=V5H699_PHOLE|nr:hypothetical protein [Photobacterium leiognathi]GAD32527.1 hypothetical protein PLEI_4203 [Photobacterium leiognathi lrivu.4.1]